MAEKFNTIDDFDIENKTVLVRIDINSPVDPSSNALVTGSRNAPTSLTKQRGIYCMNLRD